MLSSSVRRDSTSLPEYFDSQAEFWRELYRQESVYAAVHSLRHARALDLLGSRRLAAGSQVLEIGCGAGLASAEMAEWGYVVTAVDSAPEMLRSVRRLTAERGLSGIHPNLADARLLPFPDSAFDAVMALGVLPWLPDLASPLREMARVLRPGGYLIASVDSAWRLDRILNPLATLSNLAARALSGLGLRAPKAPRTWTCAPGAFDAALAELGIEKICGSVIGFGPFRIQRYRLLPERLGLALNCRLQAMADAGFPLIRSLGDQYLVLAEKTR